jgi:hypothetical protein
MHVNYDRDTREYVIRLKWSEAAGLHSELPDVGGLGSGAPGTHEFLRRLGEALYPIGPGDGGVVRPEDLI